MGHGTLLEGFGGGRGPFMSVRMGAVDRSGVVVLFEQGQCGSDRVQALADMLEEICAPNHEPDMARGAHHHVRRLSR
ncbi:hypothetical protein [Bifidobacterium indicum]|uniref:hypothetical protein n=1 Tax=Bifidobacterium indicum TaxID=1691 RepID=UPI0030D979F3